LVVSAQQWLGWQRLSNNKHKREEAEIRSSSWREVAVGWINWQGQLRNGRGCSDKDNGNTNNNKDAETTTTTTTTMVAGSIGINTGMKAAAALHQGLTTEGKHS
jgi:hypothetical protein